MSKNLPTQRRPHDAFTLIELLVVVTIATLILGFLIPPAVSSALIRAQTTREDTALADLKKDIEQSFETRELGTINVSAASNPGMVAGGSVTDDIDGTVAVATFSTSTAPAYPSISGNEWFSRIARARGIAVAAGAAVTKTTQSAIYDLLFSAADRPRLLIKAPAETNRQRYLLVSVVGRSDELALPAYVNSQAWFDGIWNTAWDRSDATLPATWTSGLTAAEATNWNADSPGKSRLPRLRVVRITQRRHDLVVNCLHPTDQVWVAYNTLATYTPGVTAAPATLFAAGSGTNTISGLLEGRVVRLWVGSSWANAKLTEQTIRGRTVYTAQ